MVYFSSGIASFMLKASVILATYNWPEALKIVLDSLVSQLSQFPNLELVIADDGSNRSTTDLIQSYRSKITNLKHIWHEDNGFRKSAILNKAVAASSGDYLLFLDGDCIVFPDYIKEQLVLAEHGYFVAGNRVLLSEDFTNSILNNDNQLRQIINWGVIDWFRAKLSGKVNKLLPWLRLGATNFLRYLRTTVWRYPKGCNFALWRKDFIAVNGFDESFSGWGHEDSDLFIRLLHYGVKIKDGRFAVPVLHLWHKVAARDKASTNWNQLLRRLNDATIIRAALGIEQYLK
jgi:glycosyltransferase involved in cell wall biosynthesis